MVNSEIMKKDTMEYRMMQEKHRLKNIEAKLLLSGSTNDKYPISLDGGKTIIFIKDKSKEEETRNRYAGRLNYRPFSPVRKTK
jgi:hypothetical protein